MKNNDKYYVISSEDIGPNAEPLNEIVTITTEPGRTNLSNEIKIDGWLGTSNNTSDRAHGEFDTLESAKKYISENWPGYSEFDNEYTESDDEDLFYKDIRIVWDVADWLYESARSDISENTTDEQITELVKKYENDADEENIYINGDIENYLTECRDELIADLEN